MIWPRLASAALIVLVLSLSLKAWALDRSSSSEIAKPDLDTLARSMRDDGFPPKIDATRPFVIGVRGGCRVKARLVDPYGTQRYALAQNDRRFGALYYAYRGEWGREPPQVRPLLEYYAQRELARLGIATVAAPVVSIALDRGCPAMPRVRSQLGLALR